MCNTSRGDMLMNRLERHGFVVDNDKSKFNNVFNGKKFSRIHIDLYSDKPYMLLSRVREMNTSVFFENGRIILKAKDGTVLVNVLFDSICEYAMKKGTEYYQFILAIQGIWYKILVVM